MVDNGAELHTWEVAFKYLIKIFNKNGTLNSEVTDLQKNRKALHPIFCPSGNFLSFLPSSASIRYFKITPETLILTYTGGLLGGGVCCSSKKSVQAFSSVPANHVNVVPKEPENKSPLATDPEKFTPLTSSEKTELNNRYEMLHKENSQNSASLDKQFTEAMQIANRVSEQVIYASVSFYDLKLLMKISKVSKPFAVACELGKNFASSEFLNSPMCLGQRLKLIRVIRKYVVQDFVENRDKILKNEEMSILVKNLNEASIALENQHRLLEFVTLLEINAVRNLIERSRSTIDWWEKVAFECKEVLEVSINPQNNISQNIKKISEYFNKNWKKLNGYFTEYFIYMSLYDKSSGQQDLLEEVIRSQLKSFPDIPYEEQAALLSYIEKWIHSNKIRGKYIEEFLQSFETICSNSNWKVRIQACYLLRVLRGLKDEGIKQKAFDLSETRIKVENDEKVLAILKMPTIYSVSKKTDVKVNMVDLLDFGKIVSREGEIAQITNFFKRKPESGEQRHIVVLCGSSGIGKTATALKYAREKSASYSFIIQINCESENTIVTTYSGYAHIKKILEKDDKNAFAKLKSYLQGLTKTGLIILDDAQNFESIKEYLVDNKNIDFLATSRNANWQNKVMVSELSIEASVTALQIRLNSFEESQAQKLICEKIGGIPLTIKRVAGDILKLKTTAQSYLADFPNKLIKNQAFDLVTESLISNLPNEALEILRIIAHCAPKRIPSRMIKTVFLKSNSKSNWLKGKSALINYYFITFGELTWSIDQATSEILLKHISNEHKHQLINYLYEFFIVDPHKPELFHNILELLPHAEKILSHPPENTKEIELLAYISRAYTLVVRDSQIALIYAEKAVGALEPIKGENERAYFKLGEVFREIGKYDRSDELLRQSLSVLDNNPGTKLLADAYFALGLLYKHQILYEKSKEWFIKSLEIQEKILSPMHSDLAFTYTYIGMIFKDLGKYDQSEEYLMKALRIQEHIYQSNDPALASAYNYLGSMYRSRGKLEQSEYYLLKCLKIQENILDPLHPALAVTYNVLGKLYTDLKKWDKGEEYYLKCLHVRESLLEVKHAHLVITYQNIAIFYQKMGDLNKSEFYKSKAC
ncbi:hypothetical protein SteCoe_34257 [Stentor coeruleus]|uniref:AAA+ ATPase domain-containing protein n=1 Tax=Stentor coeruleus TaxID=5963 RepID=A0A1R2AUX3_9CILI|nr:hypothetical protein SteCoe_34257 [Stentor coeruleus]